ncbi:MAG: glycosyltransferase family 2 protein [Acidimicrobiia bacterium]|nr:glycosyltransferase family 2 protein [Acidimicrobiia bacterium]
MPGTEAAAGAGTADADRADCPPVVLLVFNRPDLTARVFEVVRRVRPRQLLLIADGPRDGKPDDAALCQATRDVLADIDWPCDVLRRYADRNLGCGPAVSGGLDWAFEQVPEAVILEDDCLTDPSFFPFCAELLDRFREDGRVMQVAGSNLNAPVAAYLGSSYSFNAFSPVWGWATWRDAWARYDYSMSTWPHFRDSGLMAGLPAGRRWQATLRRDWDRAHRGEATWDHQWQYAVMSGHGLSVSPCVNLVSNLGFRADATQTFLAGDLAEIPAGPMTFPLRHPQLVAENPLVERHMERQMLEHTGRGVELLRRALPSHRARRFLKGVLRPART